MASQSMERLRQYTLKETIINNNIYTLHTSSTEDGAVVFIERLNDTDTDLVSKFEDRVQLLKDNEHPAIPPIIDSGKDEDGQPFIIYSPAAGTLLSQKLHVEGTPFTEIESLQLGKQMAEAFTHLELHGMIHLDLRPENIIVTDDQQMQLLSLASPHQARLENPPFSKEYMGFSSPEQLSSKSLRTQSNVYSLGVLMYNLLVGHPPKYQTTDWDIFSQESDIPYTPLSRAAPRLAPQTYQLVRQCLGRQTWSRFSQLTDLVSAFDRAIEAAAAPREDEAKAAIPSLMPGNNRLVWGSVALVVALVLIGFLAVFRARQIRESQNNIDTNTPVPVVGDEPTSTPTRTPRPPTSTPIPNEATLLQPPNGADFTNQDSITFAWTWTNELEDEELFVLILRRGNQIVYQVEVEEPVGNSRYEHEAMLANIADESGDYRWQVILQEQDGTIVYSSPQGAFEVLVRTPTPTNTATPAETATPTNTPTPTPTATPEECVPTLPPGWARYSYKSGDLLFNLAIETGTTVAEIERVSCVSSTTISAGQEIFLPFLPATETPIPPTPEPTTPSGGGGGGGGGNPGPPNTPTPPSLPGG